MTVIWFAAVLAHVMMGAVLNRWRGGVEIGAIHVGKIVKVAVLSLWMGLPLFLVTQPIPYAAFAIVTILGFVFGWGSYMDLGTNSAEYKVEVLPIDYLLYWVFGSKWIPAAESNPEQYRRFDVIDSPTGDVRPLNWRVRRDTVGMYLRGMLFGVPVVAALYAVSLFFGGLDPRWLVYLLVFVPFGASYQLGLKMSFTKYGNAGPEMGEILWGMLGCLSTWGMVLLFLV